MKPKYSLIALFFCILIQNAQTQSAQNFWTAPTNIAARPTNLPTSTATLTADIFAMRLALTSVKEGNLNTVKSSETNVFSLPMPDGNFKNFVVVSSPIMHPDLAAKFPEIKTFAGKNLDGSGDYARFDLTENGFNAIIFQNNGNIVLIDALANNIDNANNLATCFIYKKNEASRTSTFACLSDDLSNNFDLNVGNTANRLLGDCQLRTYDLALACTGEYAQFHGGTVPLVMSAMTTTMNRVNGVFEREFSVHLNMVANNNLLIYLNAATDPYTNDDGLMMLEENQMTVDAVIGVTNYDLGHVFSTGGGGVAYQGIPCYDPYKAGGVTGLNNPIGDAFDIDFVCHEMGHQFGGSHTMNNDCNRNDPTAYEPGSGTTIMAYAGVCPPNVQNNSNDYFHLASLLEITDVITGFGGTCATNSNLNTSPTAEAGLNYTIPKSTYFVLNGAATDANDTNLTYCWEEFDNGIAVQPPLSTHTVSPLFRSLNPTTNSKRYFPNLTAILANTIPVWEVLPAVARNLNFRLTVRDNHLGGGCTASDNMLVTVDGSSGPFLMTSHNTISSLAGGQNTTITWDVAGTTAAPVSAVNVDILLSIDGGLTFSTVLVANTPNDGTQSVLIPSTTVASARLMVRGSGNIFFDVNNKNFSITPSALPACSNAPVINQLDVYDNSGTSGDYNACHNVPINFGAFVQAGTGDGVINWLWTVTPAANAVITGPTNTNFANVLMTNTTALSLNVTVTAYATDASGCKDTSFVIVPVKPQITVDSVARMDNSGSINDGGICFGDSIQMKVIYHPSSTYTYAWSNGLTTESVFFPPPYNNAQTVYTVTVSDGFGCTAAGFSSAKGFTKINATGSYSMVCDTLIMDTLTTVISGGVPTPLGYLVTIAPSNTAVFHQSPFIYPFQGQNAGLISMEIKDEKGCILDYKYHITGDTCANMPCNPVINTICPGESYTISVDASAVQNIQWYKNGNVISGATMSSYVVSTIGNYTYTANNVDGCFVESCCGVYFKACVPTCPAVICLPVKIVKSW
jgi:Metallo-peptidase family M12B Reprolysin-like